MKFNILGKEFNISENGYFPNEIILDNDDIKGLYTKYIKFIKVIIDSISILSIHEYFSKQLWRDKFDFHPASVAVSFLARSLYYHGIYIREIGSTFALTDDKTKSLSFINQFDDLFKDYSSWCTKESGVDHFEVTH